MADELGDFRVGAIEFLLVSGEIDAPAPNAGGFLQVTLPKARQSILLPSPLSGKRASDEALRLIRRNPGCEPELPYSAVVVATCVSEDYARAQPIGSPIRSTWVAPRHLGMKIPGADHRDDRSFKASAN